MQYESEETDGSTVQTFIGALEAKEFERAANYLDDGFYCGGWAPQLLNKHDFLGTVSGLKEGIPSLAFNLHELKEHDKHTVSAEMQITGYQSDSFILPALGTPPIPQTASTISLPPEPVSFTLSNDKITRMEVRHVSGGGIQGLLRQLGFEAPLIG